MEIKKVLTTGLAALMSVSMLGAMAQNAPPAVYVIRLPTTTGLRPKRSDTGPNISEASVRNRKNPMSVKFTTCSVVLK